MKTTSRTNTNPIANPQPPQGRAYEQPQRSTTNAETVRAQLDARLPTAQPPFVDGSASLEGEHANATWRDVGVTTNVALPSVADVMANPIND